jgi:hypothetical protein
MLLQKDIGFKIIILAKQHGLEIAWELVDGREDSSGPPRRMTCP